MNTTDCTSVLSLDYVFEHNSSISALSPISGEFLSLLGPPSQQRNILPPESNPETGLFSDIWDVSGTSQQPQSDHSMYNPPQPLPVPEIGDIVTRPSPQRRRNPERSSVGPNPYGRNGTLRCQLCRHWRRKCIFNAETPELPCTLCKDRGVACTKVWGRERQRRISEYSMQQTSLVCTLLTQSPGLRSLTSDHLVYIREFEHLWDAQRRGPRQFRSQLAGQWVPLYKVQRPHSSALFHFAISVFMAYQQNNYDQLETQRYLLTFLNASQRRVVNSAIQLDIVYSSYIMAVYSLVAGESLQQALMNCSLFCQSIANLKQSGIVEREELSWIEMLWQEVMFSLYYIHRETLFRGIVGRARVEESFDQFYEMLNISRFFLPSKQDFEKLPLSMNTETICQKIQTLSIYMQLYFEYFLFRKSRGDENTQEIVVVLQSVLEKITCFTIRLPNIPDLIHNAYSISSDSSPNSDRLTADELLHYQIVPLKLAVDPKLRDITLAQLYTFARLIKNLLEQSTTALNDELLAEIQRSSIALCRLCATIPGSSFQMRMTPLLVKRTLFWAGLILTKSKFASAHLWIKESLKQCIQSGFNPPHHGPIDEEEEIIQKLMEESDRRTSFNDIWTVKVGDVSLYYYTATFLTWFSGLNLVRFECTSRTRRLRII